TAHNLSLVYDSVLAQPDQVIEADIGLSTATAMNETLTAMLTFNGTAQAPVYFNMDSLPGTSPYIHLAQQVDTSGLASGRYPWSMTVTSPNMQAPATISGYVDVVNDSASPFGQGWDMPGLLRLFQNNVQGVPAGVLLSAGDGGAFYYAANGDGSYASPPGPYAFSTLTSLTGGGWQLLTHDGVTFTFNSSGYLVSRRERNGETTDFTWTGADLTAITGQFRRSIALGYSGGLLSSIQDFAGNTWAVTHSGVNLASVTEPDPGGGSPVWQYAYSGNYMSSETDPDGNQTSFALDGYHRLSGTTLANSDSTADTSEQDFGFGSTNSSSPANLTMQPAVLPAAKDADGNTSSYQTDQFGDVISETNAAGFTTSIQRDADGLPTVITLPPPTAGAADPVTDIYYDSTGDETSATGAQSTYGTFTYTADSFGQWATFTDTTGHEWTRTFDTNGNILTETTPSGMQVSWTYDTYGRPLTMSLPAPNDAGGTVSTQYFYDADERLIEILWPDGTSQHFGYNADDFQTSSEDEDGNTTITGRDALNRVVTVTNAASGVTSTTYDKAGNVLTTETPMGEVTTDSYNSMNELMQQTLPPQIAGGTAPVLSWTYNGDGLKLTSTDALGRETQFDYNDLNELIQEIFPAATTGAPSPSIEYAYNNLGQQTSETNQLGGVTYTNYGNTDISQVTSVVAPPPNGSGSGPSTSYFYDTDGRQDQVENALGQFTTTAFTIDGQVASVKDNLGNTTTDTYGNAGELLQTVDPLTHATSDEYDSRFRLTQTTDANGGITQITLDGVGNTAKLVDSDNNATSSTFNALNLPVSETNALGTTTTGYNADGLVTSIQDADGRVRDFDYNDDQQLTAENWMSGSTIIASMAYGYDLAGELTSASDPNSAYAFAFNGDGQVTSVDSAGTPNIPHVVLSATYDLAGDLTSQSATIAGTADFLNTYSYDGDRQLTTIQQQDQNGGNVVSPKEIDYAYNALAQFTSVVDYNTLSGPRTDVLTGTSTYDGDSRLTGLAYTSDAGGNSIDTFGWSYNAGSLLTSFTSGDGTADYSNGPTNQLTSATYTTASGGHQPANASYSYTANGNRDSSGYTTGSDNLMTSDGTFNYTYDADGNTIGSTRLSSAYATDYLTTFSWDYRNRLADVDYYDNNDVLTKHVHYLYDVFDNLIGEEDDDTGSGSYDHEEFYAVDGIPQVPAAGQPFGQDAQPLLQFNGDGSLTVRNLLATNPAGVDAIMVQETVFSLSEGGAVNSMVADNQGSVRAVVDTTGNIIDRVNYAVFGTIAFESDLTVLHWADFEGGHLSVASGLENFDERWLNSSTGDWLSQDPSGFPAGDTNLSRYVGNDPTNGIDPTGLFVMAQWFSMAGGMMTFSYQTLWDNGTVQNSVVNVPILSQAIIGPTPMAVSNHPIDPSVPLTPAQTSYISETIANLDPDYAEKLTEAQHEATQLANTATTFYAMGPFFVTPANIVGPTANKVTTILQKLQQEEARLTEAIEEAKAAGETTKAVNLTVKLEALLRKMGDLQAWRSFISSVWTGE
ncbi:MAG TPA: RHS repeat-associated core domain-containing protein, partial [Pirellulales bacterium]|nr:RHS repeat-associated core domain-containing protein [Pirellulales bacterium]